MFAELDRLQSTLQTYINATYHLSHPQMVALRQALLSRPGALQQRPFIESTPRYQSTGSYQQLSDKEIPPLVRSFFAELADAGVLFKEPYTHQAQAIQATLVDKQDLVITTGTGSGKSESFMLPILGRLAEEASRSPGAFKQRAVRALLMYPMNALVNDQLGRIRGLFGAPEVTSWFTARAGRPAKFGRYTGKTLYPGHKRPGAKHGARLSQMKFYVDLEEQARDGDIEARSLIRELQKIGKWPSKPPSEPGGFDGMTQWFGKKGQSWKNRTLEDLSRDPELLIRHEIQDNPPDLLITNYSMLEYMLLRPIERDIFRRTSAFFRKHRSERFFLVLDEAHLYRGSTGAEIGMLVRRLRGRLGLTPEQLTIISTSASFSDKVRAKEFVAGLTGKSVDGFKVLTGDKDKHSPDGLGSIKLAARLAVLPLDELHEAVAAERFSKLKPLFSEATLKARRVVAESTHAVTLSVSGVGADGTVNTEKITVSGGQAATSGAFLVLTDAEFVGVHDDEAEVSLRFEGEPLLASLGLTGMSFPPGKDPLCRVLWDALAEEPVVGRLINITSGNGQDLERLPGLLFPESGEVEARDATRALLELCPAARDRVDDRPLLAARVHVFLRGLPGLWACTNPDCSELSEEQRGSGPTGKLFSEPVRRCPCGSRVFELHSCRSCGSAFFSVWADDPNHPRYLWQEEIGKIEDAGQVQPLTIALQQPESSKAREAILECESGKLYIDEQCDAETCREVWIPARDEEWKSPSQYEPGWFSSCPCCGAGGYRYPIQNHTTSGDDPFMEVTREQLMLQPARPEVKTPLSGRKVLVFSDGRQMASRLSGKLQEGALRDSARPLLLFGIQNLKTAYDTQIPLSWSYLAVLAACVQLGVEPRPKQATFIVEDLARVRERLFHEDAGQLKLTPGRFDIARALVTQLSQDRNGQNSALMSVLLPVLNDPHTGLSALGLADVEPILDEFDLSKLSKLTPPTGGAWAKLEGDDARMALVQLWLQLMMDRRTMDLPTTPLDWLEKKRGPKIDRNKGSFKSFLNKLLPSSFHSSSFTTSKTGKRRPWLRFLYDALGSSQNQDGFLLSPEKVTLRTEGLEWARCQRCTAVQPLIPGLKRTCFKSWGGSGRCTGALETIDPGDGSKSESARIFRARKGHYRLPYERLIAEGVPPHPFNSAPHTAALNSSGEGKAMGLAELHELRFQDIPVPDEDADENQPLPPIDVLSVTTTMEVGIDIGSLTAVALRNVPPGRANYQQRAGRAGRRGSALSLVVTWCGADSHDQQFFSSPEAMISGPVPDPKLSIHNRFIVRRHLFAAIISRFQLERVPDPEPGAGNANIFESLGSLTEFREGAASDFSYEGLKEWMQVEEASLVEELEPLLPDELIKEPAARADYIRQVLGEFLKALREAGAAPLPVGAEPEPEEEPEQDNIQALEEQLKKTEALMQANDNPLMAKLLSESRSELIRQLDDLREELGLYEDEDENELLFSSGTDPDQDADERKLLDRLFAKGILPRYAFPTSVVGLHVFDRNKSTSRQAVMEHAPQRDLNQALSSYAPGREVWINGERHYSFAIWSPFSRDRWRAWHRRQLYLSCGVCGYAELRSRETCSVNDTDKCEACGADGQLGPAMLWLRPPGFAHPVKLGRALPSGKSPAPTRPTRARLYAKFKGDPISSLDRVSVWTSNETLIVTNTGANERGGIQGFRYCASCGLAEPNTLRPAVFTPVHERPSPDHRGKGETCSHSYSIVALGNEFSTDVTVLRFKTGDGLTLRPDTAAYEVVLKTLAIALTKAAVSKLDIEPDDIAGEHRVALTDEGQKGREVEVFLYDKAAGGAGFVRDAVARVIDEEGNSTEDPEEGLLDLLTRALDILEGCSNPDCTSSCYQCLRSYKNKWDHADLDRLLAAAFLRNCLYGEAPTVSPEVENQLLKTLVLELVDAREDLEVKREPGYLWLEGAGRAVVVSHPLSPGVPGSERAAAAPNPIAISQLIIERNLPLALQLAVGEMEIAEESELPPCLIESENGLPTYRLSEFSSGEDPIGKYTIGAGLGSFADPDKYMLLIVDSHLVDKEAELGQVLLARRPVVPVPTGKEDGVVIVRRAARKFRFTEARWAIGTLHLRRGNQLIVSYRADHKKALVETVAKKRSGPFQGVELLAEIRRVITAGGELKHLSIKKNGD